MENCQVCDDIDCTTNSLEVIKDACSDNTPLSVFMSQPLSTSTEVNQYIDQINSEFSYQLAEFTLFQFLKTNQSKFIINLFEQTNRTKNNLSYNRLWYCPYSKASYRSKQTKACFQTELNCITSIWYKSCQDLLKTLPAISMANVKCQLEIRQHASGVPMMKDAEFLSKG